jgi:hypothetical protein
LADGGYVVDMIDVSLKMYGRRRSATDQKLNRSNPLRAPDGLAFPLLSKTKPSLPASC